MYDIRFLDILRIENISKPNLPKLGKSKFWNYIPLI